MATVIKHQVARSPAARCEPVSISHTICRLRDVVRDRIAVRRGEWLLLTALMIGACSTAPSPTATDATPSAVSLNVVAGDAQQAPVNTALPQAVRVQVLDNNGHPVANFLLNFVVTSGGGRVYGGVEETNSSGYADEQWTLGPRLGPQTLDVRQVNSWSGVAASYGKFTATGTPPNNVMVVTTGGPTGLAVMNADGSGFRSVSAGSTKPAQPALSPDHTRIVFVDATNLLGGLDGDINVVNVNGTGLTFLGAGFGPTWSPDNVHVLWQFSNQYGTTLLGSDQIEGAYGGSALCVGFGWSFSADGTKLLGILGGADCDDTALTFGAGQSGLYVVPLTVGARAALAQTATDPQWSPDGQHIAATLNGQTVVMDPDGNNLKVVLPKSYGPVSWSPDSQLWAVDSGFVNADGTNYVAVKGCPCRFAWR